MTDSSINILIKPLAFSDQSMDCIKENLAHLNWSMFLESGSLDHVDSQWSIFTADPICTLTQDQESVLYHHFSTNRTTLMGHDPLQAQCIIREQFFHSESNNNYPFTGGVVAAYHYEMGELFEALHKSKQITGLGSGVFHCGFYDWAILYNIKNKQYFLLQHRIKTQSSDVHSLWQQRYQWLEKLTTECKQILPFNLNSDWRSNCSKQQYQDSFERIQHYLLSGDCYQVNLTQRFQAHYSGDEYNAYQALLVENKAPFAAFIRLPEQVIISLSPERFLRSINNHIQTKPIKGTMPRHSDPLQDLANKQQLLNSEKDQAENLMIVDLLRNDIGRVCEAGSVAVPHLFDIESFPAVHHLVSTVTGQLEQDKSSEDLLRACFPGGSIVGAPKIRAMEVICELENNPREIYCGSIAYINGNGDMDSSITIRTLVCQQQQIYCWAGGGIVADSKVDSEYQESFDKVSKILPVLTQLNK